MHKKTIYSTFMLITALYISSTHPMLSRIAAINPSKKLYGKHYSISKPQPGDLKKVAAQQFVLKEPFPIQTMYVLLKHHQQKREIIENCLGFSTLGLYLGVAPLGCDVCFSLIGHNPLLFSTPMIGTAVLVTALSLLPLPTLIKRYNLRNDIVKKLEIAFETGIITQPVIYSLQANTQQDITKCIEKLCIQQTKKDISNIVQKSTNIGLPWDINNSEILKDTLEGKYNSSEYVLFLQDKE
jgi:hypothetical protein